MNEKENFNQDNYLDETVIYRMSPIVLSPVMMPQDRIPRMPPMSPMSPLPEIISGSSGNLTLDYLRQIVNSPERSPLRVFDITIFQIISEGDKNKLIKFINENGENNILSKRNDTDNDDVLIFAVRENKTEIALFLINIGINLYNMNNNHHTAMYYAISMNNNILVSEIKRNRLEGREFIETEISCLINNIDNLDESIISEFNKFIHVKQIKFISIKKKAMNILNYHIKNKNITDIIGNYYLYT